MSEMIIGGVYAPLAVEEHLDDLAALYQQAFAARPWREVSKCLAPPEISRTSPDCSGGFTSQACGTDCGHCGGTVVKVAYPAAELYEKFTAPVEDGYRLWYIEKSADGIALAALSRVTSIEGLATYLDKADPLISEWVRGQYEDPTKQIVWIEDVFANTQIREKGNLANFGYMCTRLASGLIEADVAFKTVNPRLVRAAQRDFGSYAHIADASFGDIPGAGQVVTIDVAAAAQPKAA